jgi:hypothetical protein
VREGKFVIKLTYIVKHKKSGQQIGVEEWDRSGSVMHRDYAMGGLDEEGGRVSPERLRPHTW